MKKTIFLQILFLIDLFIFSSTGAAAQVQVLRVTFVSANGGSDANTCSRIDPCRNIQRGLDLTARGGTVVVLDSGEYQPFTITKSVSVVAEKGVRAVVGNAQAAAGATIEEDGTSAQVITLRGLIFADSDNGISVNASITSLTVEDCSITGGSYGIYAARAAAGLTNTTGAENSFFGRSAGRLNSTGGGNSFFGVEAGRNNTGSGNTFVGHSSGLSNTNENNNTFIGLNANGAAGITNSTAIGANSVVTASNTMVLGTAAVTVQVPGNLNIAGTFGANIINATTQYNIGGNRVLSVAGSSNLFVGASAGQTNTTGNANSFVGSNAGRSNTSGGLFWANFFCNRDRSRSSS